MKSRRTSVAVAATTLALAALLATNASRAQTAAPGEAVAIPGIGIDGWGRVAEVAGRFGRPAGASTKVPAVLLLHGSNGIDGRGAFYATALQSGGIATLEIEMFSPGGRPGAGVTRTLPHAAAALKWLAAQPEIDSKRLGVLGFSWGAAMAVWMSSEDTQQRMGKDVPSPIASAALYPVCSNIVRNAAHNESTAHLAMQRMSPAPLLIFVGTLDDYEQGVRPCDALVAMWPTAAREHATVRYVEGATHAFDSQTGPRQFYERLVHGGQGGIVNVIPNPQAAADARREVVSFFVRNLKP